MGKSSKVAAAVARSVNPVFAAAILDKAREVAAEAVDTQVNIGQSTDTFRESFRELCSLAGVPIVKDADGREVFNRDSEVGKALHKVLHDMATDEARKREHYSVKVHKVGQDDKFLPVRIWSSLFSKWLPVNKSGQVAEKGDELIEANHVFTASFALGVDLKSLAGTAEKPLGAKAWLRGGQNGERPDGIKQGMRDWIKNDVDQALSRGWKSEAVKRAGGNKNDFADLLNGLHKAGTKKRARWEKDHGEGSVVSEDQWATLCSIIVEAAFDPDICDELIGRSDRT